MKTTKYINYNFESSCYKTEEFIQFSRDFKSDLKKIIGDAYTLVNFSVGHFYLSGFIENKATKKLAYFSTSDVRGCNNEWHNSLLIRTAEHIKDFSGGRNKFTSLEKIAESLDDLTK